MTTQKRFLFAAGVAAASVLMAGCGPKTDTTTTAPAAAPGTSATTPAAPGTAAIPAATPPPGAGASRPDMAGPGPGMTQGGVPSNYGGAPKNK